MIDMTTAGPLRGLAVELQRQLATKRDLIADTRRVSFETPGYNQEGPVAIPAIQLNIDLPEGAESFELTRHAHQQIATHLGIGSALYERLLYGIEPQGNRRKKRHAHPDLLAHLATGLFNREPNKRMFRTMDGKVRACLSNRYRPRDNWDLLEAAVLPVLNEYSGNVVIQKCDLTETRMYVKIELPDFVAPITPKKGDVIHGGLIIQNSEVGSGSLGVYPYSTRLICLNGAVHTEYGQRQRHVGKRIESDEEAWEMYSDATLELDDKAFFAKCQDTVRGVLNETVFEAIVGQMRDLADIRIAGAPDAVVELFAKTNDLNENERGSMLTALIMGSDLSAWGYVNALTETARDIENPERQVTLQKLAGKLIADPKWALA